VANQYFKNYQLISGISIFLLGVVLYLTLPFPTAIFGIVLITVSLLFFIALFYSNYGNSGNHRFRSRTREQILKQHFDD